jgi:hypothetical protein
MDLKKKRKKENKPKHSITGPLPSPPLLSVSFFYAGPSPFGP